MYFYSLLLLESFVSAKWYRNYFREIEPAAYNQSQSKEKRLPVGLCEANAREISPADEDDEESNSDHTENVGEQNTEATIAQANASDQSTFFDENEFELNEAFDLNNEGPEDEEVSLNLPSVSDNVDDKQPLNNVQLDDTEASVFNNIFDGASNTDNTSNEQSAINEHLNVSPGGTKKITQVIDDECQITFEIGRDMFKPADAGYQVKINDLLTDNIPFKENVS